MVVRDMAEDMAEIIQAAVPAISAVTFCVQMPFVNAWEGICVHASDL